LGKGGKVTAGRVLFEGRDLLSMTEQELDGVRGDRLTMISLP
jgi:peptide/nickel transport system ATP-binding protein